MKFKTVRRVMAMFFPRYRARLIEQVGGEVARECRAGVPEERRPVVNRMARCVRVPAMAGTMAAQV